MRLVFRFYFFFCSVFLIGNGPRASRSRSHALAVLVRSLFLSSLLTTRSAALALAKNVDAGRLMAEVYTK